MTEEGRGSREEGEGGERAMPGRAGAGEEEEGGGRGRRRIWDKFVHNCSS